MYALCVVQIPKSKHLRPLKRKTPSSKIRITYFIQFFLDKGSKITLLPASAGHPLQVSVSKYDRLSFSKKKKSTECSHDYHLNTADKFASSERTKLV